jgi:ABC-type tungstate transport system permease subunit
MSTHDMPQARGDREAELAIGKAPLFCGLSDWLTSPAGQAKIASYKVDNQQLFFPDYVKP